MLSDVSILITAGFRIGYLEATRNQLATVLPETKSVIVTDDGYTPHQVFQDEFWYHVPYDTYLTRKRNLGVSVIDTKYTLVAADDFEWTMETRAHVIKMTEVLDSFEFADVIAGTVNDKRYEGFLEIKEGEYIKERQLDEKRIHGECVITSGGIYYHVDLAVNFFLARTHILRYVPWDESIGPIGGEHADWFLDMKEKNRTVLWTTGLNINEQPRNPRAEDPNYRARRNRAQIGHELFLKKRGVKRYIGFHESIGE